MDLPEAVAHLTLGRPCSADPQGGISIGQGSASLSTVMIGHEVASVSTNAQYPRLNPIEMIPVELFQDMLWEAMKESLPSSAMGYYHALTQIRLVCRRWTATLEGMPIIWAKLSPSMDQRLIDLALSRSMHCPLTITGYLSSSPALDKLLQHTCRWKVLRVGIKNGSSSDCLAGYSVPLLEELSLEPSSSNPPITLFDGTAPRLRVVCINQRGVQWSTSVLSNLHELTLFDVQQGSPGVDTFLQILSNSPELTRLRVRNTPLAHSPSPQTRISLSRLRSLELEYLGKRILKQLVESIDIPTSTKCLFSVSIDDYEWTPDYEQLEPISQRIKTLAKASRGTKSTLTLEHLSHRWTESVRMAYERGADQHGAFTAQVETRTGTYVGIYAYFAHQLGQGEPNPVPPSLHIVRPSDPSHDGNDSKLLQRLHDHLPDIDEIVLEEPSSKFIEDAFNTLFPSSQAPRLFPQLSTLTIRHYTHEKWAYWLERRQQRLFWRGVDPLPLQTLKIEGGTIGAERVKALEKLVLNLVLNRVVIR